MDRSAPGTSDTNGEGQNLTDYKFKIFTNNNKFFAVSGVILASIAFVMELTLIPLLLVEIQRDLDLTVKELSWIFNSYAIAVAFAVILTGIIGDRVDKIALFTVGVLLFTVGSISASMSETYGALLAGRTIQGIGGGLFSPLIPILLSQVFHDKPGKILIVWGCLAGVVATLMPLIGGQTIELFGWQVIFIYFACVSVLALLLSLGLHPFKQEKYTRASFSRHFFISNPAIWPMLGYIFLTYGAFSCLIFYFPIQMAKASYSNEFIAGFVTTIWLSFSLVSFALRNKVDSSQLGSILVAAPLFFATGSLIGASQSETSVALLMAAVFTGAGLACCNAPSTHLLLKLTPTKSHAFAASLDIICARCGGVVMVAAMTGASVTTLGWSAIGAATLAITCCVLCFTLARPVETEVKRS